jgi:hypothetical protein
MAARHRDVETVDQRAVIAQQGGGAGRRSSIESEQHDGAIGP